MSLRNLGLWAAIVVTGVGVGLVAPLSGMSASAQVAFVTPGLFNVLGEGAKPAEGETPKPPISIAPKPPVTGNDTPASENPANESPANENPASDDTPVKVVTPPPPPKTDPPKNVTPPPPPPEVVLAYFIAEGGGSTGPFNAKELAQKVASGALTGDTYVWTEGMADWKRARDVPELREILAAAPPPETPGFDAVAYLSGTWESDPEALEIPGVQTARIQGTVQYRRDKTYEGFGTLNMVSQGFASTLNFTVTGTYSTQNETETGFVLTLDGKATYFMDTGPFVEVINGAFPIQIVDQNTITNQKGTRSRRIR
ncbi:DUF4339 domain-containing protein [Marinovum sp. 2_MG-2023]|uniref:DUF4339 domain-containing protein n=1 Tax=unclassified Marinovum TaxID=2647166 RepID=UPI0026E20F03|nr:MULTISPECIES: DUF4339 domain-containing protein [unclassified Marinovum]MDO6730834.1 DUF4339 domain-containing protein [Marinovum sp. 2_MG-2023]MDO6779961.1 DUF4339 domain-containing protein [Marinovum sp. 1_MG-2023]